jgi:hypothetical protein
MSSIRHAGDFKMNRYALQNTFGEARLVHSHQKQWACESTTTTSTCIGSPIQALICYHVANTIG